MDLASHNFISLEDTITGMIESPSFDSGNGISWKDWLGNFIHEHAHIVEARISEYNYTEYDFPHTGRNGFLWNRLHDNLLSDKYYYMQQLEKDGITVGIPYEFWKGNIAKVFYDVTVDGWGCMGYTTSTRLSESIPVGSGHQLYEVVYGESITVTAKPFSGNKFIRWSDGVETATRTDLISGDLTVTAIFERIEE